MKTSNNATGRKGEDEACSFLTGLGHTILERNWRNSHREIDIISLDDGIIHIVEVKTRLAPLTADPLSNITRTKMDNLVKAALAYLRSPEKRLTLRGDYEVQFDIITVVYRGCDADIEYYPRAWVPMYP